MSAIGVENVRFPGQGRAAACRWVGRKDYAVTISPPPLPDLAAVAPDWPDDVVDVTDRRRILVLAVLGVEVGRNEADAVFEDPPAAS
jgi:hypothetical protein